MGQHGLRECKDPTTFLLAGTMRRELIRGIFPIDMANVRSNVGRITFRWEGHDAYDVCYEDYH
jgi:hypothetical protein